MEAKGGKEISQGLIPTELQAFFRRRGVSVQVAAVLMIVFGVLIIVYPGLVALLVGLYLIFAGAITLLGYIWKPPGTPQAKKE